MIAKLSKLLHYSIRRTFFPHCCVCCDTFEDDMIVCKSCRNKLIKNSRNGVITLYHKTKQFRGYALYKYSSDEAKSIIIHMKRYDTAALFEFCASALANQIRTVMKDYEEYTIVHIPTRKKSILKRGFDQAKILSEQTAFYLGIAYIPLLKRCGNSKEQKFLTLKERQENIKGAFKLNPKFDIPKKIILIDDVCTSGATCIECIKTLNDVGCNDIVSFFVATVQ